MWWVFEAGMRWANLGNLTDGATSYVENTGALDLSGIFLGTAIAFH
jgi:hypothetical protein